ncbi:MAG: ABC transporter ATP-binding protein [Melioribacteraceae bacterium]|jgi:ABC-2 type transport system ATP-binding protein|nr:ABC transporter ATP-binding protein [Melioribacteraceae bacterium]
MNAIEVKELTKVYKGGKSKIEVTALNNFSLSVSKGEIFGLLGPNGAGKTTLIKTLLGIVQPTTGSAKLLGKPISDYRIKNRIGFLPENHRFPNYLTAEETLKYFSQLGGNSPINSDKRIDELLSLVRMSEWKKLKVGKFSKGMMQRLGLAQAMMNNPELIFLDEPTDGIDPIGRKEIRDILIDLKNNGTTIFLNSHLLSEVELVSDRVAIMDSGKLLRMGRVDDLTTTKEAYIIETQNPISPDFVNAKYASPSSAEASFDNISIKLESSKKLSVNVKDNLELNFVIDSLRKNGINIKTISIQKNSLEELFVSLITDERGGKK